MPQDIKGAEEEIFPVPDLPAGQVHVSEIVVKKSRFITTIGHTVGADAARAFIAATAAQYADARHNCFAYNAGRPGSTTFCGCSDDGEPHGTAGQPMLNVLLHCGIGEITTVVTRYFGGILLGTGGLVKAYQDSVKQALQTLPVGERMIPALIELNIDHGLLGFLQYQLPQFRAEIISRQYGRTAVLTVRLPRRSATAFASVIREKSRGRAQITIKDG